MSTEGTDARAALEQDFGPAPLHSRDALAVMLAHPDALIALLVERGALRPIVLSGGNYPDEGGPTVYVTP